MSRPLRPLNLIALGSYPRTVQYEVNYMEESHGHVGEWIPCKVFLVNFVPDRFKLRTAMIVVDRDYECPRPILYEMVGRAWTMESGEPFSDALRVVAPCPNNCLEVHRYLLQFGNADDISAFELGYLRGIQHARQYRHKSDDIVEKLGRRLIDLGRSSLKEN
ncbi:hypothetical protein C8Q76DRAFT_797970 [Earliella scabrosa]|nr:hypothetical protein C8Q76DRAFT_797970 [Earliella scabrosa]